MNIDVLTLFPTMITSVCNTSIVGRAQRNGCVSIRTINFRFFGHHPDGRIDDAPYGGGNGMVIQAPPVCAAVDYAIDTVVARHPTSSIGHEGVSRRIVMLCPQGVPFAQRIAQQWTNTDHLILLCGHYEGFDERIREHVATDVVSLGDFVLTGGEIAACAVIDAIARLLPGVLGNAHSVAEESFTEGLLEYPQYTRPATFRHWCVPEVLLSGHHARIVEWRKKESLRKTWRMRPDLLDVRSLTEQQRRWLDEWEKDRCDD